MAFRVGQKVTRIAGFTETSPIAHNVLMGANYPSFGVVYTVRSINVWPAKTLLLLEEVNNEHIRLLIGSKLEPGFDVRGFRPVVSTSTGMAILESIRRDVSNHIPRPVREDA